MFDNYNKSLKKYRILSTKQEKLSELIDKKNQEFENLKLEVLEVEEEFSKECDSLIKNHVEKNTDFRVGNLVEFTVNKEIIKGEILKFAGSLLTRKFKHLSAFLRLTPIGHIHVDLKRLKHVK